jgi:hypothetical protein
MSQNSQCLVFALAASLTNNYSEVTAQGRKSTKLAQTLLNGNNICMVGFNDVIYIYG